MQTLFVMQGSPGSGKTTVARNLLRGILSDHSNCTTGEGEICSTDDYFVFGGVYTFDAAKLGEAHKWNQERAIAYLDKGRSVIVDNTNCQAWEAKPYVAAAVNRNIPVVFIRCDGKFKNTHGVPEEKVEQMRARMEHLSVQACIYALAPWEKGNTITLDEARRKAAEAAIEGTKWPGSGCYQGHSQWEIWGNIYRCSVYLTLDMHELGKVGHQGRFSVHFSIGKAEVERSGLDDAWN